MSNKSIKRKSSKKTVSTEKVSGLKMISFRLQPELIEQYKTRAEEEGMGYQTLMRMALNRFAKQWKKENRAL